MAAYQRALVSGLRSGLSQAAAESAARKVGDPGIGWADNLLSDPETPWVAVPYEHWQNKWGTKRAAHGKKLAVTIAGRRVVCILGDTMPHMNDITNGAVIDLAPGAQRLFGITAPAMVPVTWKWL